MGDYREARMEGLGTVSTSNLWNFENLRGFENYQTWSRDCKNALVGTGLWTVCTDTPPVSPSEFVISDGVETETRKTDKVFQKEREEWLGKQQIWETKSRVARSQIYIKCEAAQKELIEDILEASTVWSLFKNQYADQGFVSKTSTWRKYSTISIGDCGGDLTKYVIALGSLQRQLVNMGQKIDNWMTAANLLSGLEGRFQEYVTRTITMDELPSFERIAADLQELDRLKKRDTLTLSMRAQTNQKQKGQKKGKGKETQRENCADCGGPHPGPCWNTHPELKKEYQEKKDQRKKEFEKRQKKREEKEKKEKKKKEEEAAKVDTSASNYSFSFGHMVNAKTVLDPSMKNSSEDSSLDAAFLASLAEWYVDSGCTEHMTPNRRDFVEYHMVTSPHQVFVANGVAIPAIARGTVHLEGYLPGGKITTVELKGVLHVPQLSSGLFSASQITKHGGLVVFDRDECFIREKASNRLVLHASKCRNQYPLNILRTKDHIKALSAAFYSGSKYNEQTIQLWHRRLGHLNRQDLIRLQDMSTGMELTKAPKHMQPMCEACKKGKMKARPSRRPQDPVFEKNECIDSDLCGPIDPPAIGGYLYFSIKTDRATGYSWIYLLRTKDEFFTIVEEHFLPMIKTQTPAYKIKRWRTDCGTEVANNLVDALMKKLGIIWEPSAPYAKQQNGGSEKKNLTVMDAVRAILADAGLPAYLWGEILKTLVKLKNCGPVSRLRVQNMTPYEAYYNVKPDLSHFRLLGCDAWHAISKEVKGQKKLSDRGVKCKLIGYEGTHQYRLWNPATRRVFISRDVEFDESYMLAYPNQAFHWDGDSELSMPEDFATPGGDEVLPHEEANVEDIIRLDTPNRKSLDRQHGGQSSQEDEIESNPRSPPPSPPAERVRESASLDERLLHPDPHPDATYTELPRQSGRRRQPTERRRLNDRWDDKDNWGRQAAMVVEQGYFEDLVAASQQSYCREVTVQKATEDDAQYDHDFDPDEDFNALIDLAKAHVAEAASLEEEPMTIKEALAGPYKAQWKAALDAEMNAHKKMGTYKRVRLSSLPPGTKILTSRMVFKVKRDVNGAVKKFKARWCARGFEQRFGVNFTDTYASVVKSMSYKALFAIIAHEDLECEQMDVITAFLNSILKEKIYIWPPEGFEEDGWVWLLIRALYGLKQSPREWYQTLSEFLISQGFQRLESDHSIFVNNKTRLIVPVYVDDLLIIGPKNSSQIGKLKKVLNKRFEMTDLGPCNHYLGMAVTRDRANRTLHLSQKTYIEKVLARFGMQDCKASVTPMDVGVNLEAEHDHQATVGEVKYYQAQVGCLLYLTTQTRLDIAIAVQRLGRFNLNPSKPAEGATKKVLRYLQGTKELGITYGGGDGLLGYTDADWAGDSTTRKSTGAYLFTLYGGAISWSSKLQTCVALSSCESEYMAQTQASKEAVWISRLLKELDLGYGLPSMPVSIKADNQGAIALSTDPKFHSRTKHIDVQWHFVREMVEKGCIRLEYCPTEEMAADGLTKPLEKVKFGRFIRQIGLTTKV